ncbi:hypothetical protein D3C83_212960 [compost metagenome]
MHGLFDDQLHANRGREVKHDVAAIDELREQRLAVHGVDEVFESRASLEVGDVVDRPGREIVEDQDLVSLVKERL